MHKEVEQIKDILKSSFISLIAYNYGLHEQYALVVKNYTFKDSKALGKICKKHRVLVFTREDFIGGQDVFPVDFAMMQKSYHLVDGEDLISSVKINKKHLRHQLEYLLRSARIQLKTQSVMAGDKKVAKALIEILLPLFQAIDIFTGTLDKKRDAKLESVSEMKAIDAVKTADKLLADAIKEIN